MEFQGNFSNLTQVKCTRRTSSPTRTPLLVSQDADDERYAKFVERLRQPMRECKVRGSIRDRSALTGNATGKAKTPAGSYVMVFERSFDLAQFEAFEDLAYSEEAVLREEERLQGYADFGAVNQPACYYQGYFCETMRMVVYNPFYFVY